MLNRAAELLKTRPEVVALSFARMADALFWLLDTYGTLPDDATLAVDLKRSDLAALSNMTTANAIRILSAFAKEDLIKTDHRKIMIRNRRGLQEVSLLGR